ncbi:MAG: hypothetical protein WCH75_11790 [Candidatus Binatia bacterium]
MAHVKVTNHLNAFCRAAYGGLHEPGSLLASKPPTAIHAAVSRGQFQPIQEKDWNFIRREERLEENLFVRQVKMDREISDQGLGTLDIGPKSNRQLCWI